MIVHFENVGRNRTSWTERLDREDIEAVYRAVLKKKVLMSKGVEVIANDDGQGGIICAGHNIVGKYRIEWGPR